MSELAYQEKAEYEVEPFTQERPAGTSQFPFASRRKDDLRDNPIVAFYRDHPAYSGSVPQDLKRSPTLVDQEVAARKPTNPFPQAAPRLMTRSTFVVRQKWEASVLEVGSDSFTASLTDLTGEESDEVAEFDVGDVAKDDLKLLEPGAVFYWSIGYYTNDEGTVRRTSEIRFRRLPSWSTSDINRAESKAKEMLEALGDIRA